MTDDPFPPLDAFVADAVRLTEKPDAELGMYITPWLTCCYRAAADGNLTRARQFRDFLNAALLCAAQVVEEGERRERKAT